jgi:hypothetical protein
VSVLTLADTKVYLNISQATYDAELQTFIDSAEAAIAKRCGPLASTATTKQVDGRGTSLILPLTPVISLTSITGNAGEVVATTDVTVLSPGIVRYTNGGYWFGSLWYTVVYNAGRSTVPADLLMAVKELVRHFWITQRGSARSGPTGDSEGGPGYLWPYRVLELLAPYTQPGFS